MADTTHYYCASDKIKVYPAGYRSASIDIEASRTTEGSVRKQSNAPLFKTSYAKFDGNDKLIFVLDGYVAEIADVDALTKSIYTTTTQKKGDCIYAVLSTHVISDVKVSDASTDTQKMVMMVGDKTTDDNIVKQLDQSADGDVSNFTGIYFTTSKPEAGTYVAVLAYDGSSWVIPKASKLNISTTQISDIGGQDNTKPISEQLTTGSITAGSVSVTDGLSAGSAEVGGKITAGSMSVTDGLSAGSVSVGSADIKGQLTSSGEVTVAGATKFNSALTAKQDVEVGGNTTVEGKLTAKDGLTANGGVNVQSGGMMVTGGGVSVTGEAKFNSELTANGDVTVSGASSFAKNLTANSGATVKGKLTVDGGTLSVTGSDGATAGTLEVSKTLKSSGDATAGAINVSNTLKSNSDASAYALTVTKTLSVKGDDPSSGAAATAGTLEVSKTLKSSGDATAKYFDVGSGTLSVTGVDTTDTKAASVNGLAVSSGTLFVTGDASASSLSVGNTLDVTNALAVTGVNTVDSDGVTAAARVGALNVTNALSSGSASANNVVVEGQLSATTTNSDEIGVSTKTLSTPSLTASGSVSVTGNDSLNYSGISQAVTTNNNEDKPVWISKGKVNSNNKGIPTIADGLTYNPQTRTLTAKNISGNASSSSKLDHSVTFKVTGDVTGKATASNLSGTVSGTEVSIATEIAAGKVGASELADNSVTSAKLGSIIATNSGSATSNGMTVTLSQTDSKGGLSINLSGTSTNATNVSVTTSTSKLYLLGATGTSGNQACYAHSTVYATAGVMNAHSYNANSDRRLKENIVGYHCEKSILDLPVKKFDFIDGPKNQIGCIAQDLQEICPEIVHENSDGYLSIQESKIVYLLLEEVKRLRKEVDELKEAR